MSERKVLGWAVKRNSHHFWLKVAFESGGLWNAKGNRAVFATCDKARAAKAAVATCNTGVTVVRIVAKPKAPKPDKLEQAIAMVRERAKKCRQSEAGHARVQSWSTALVFQNYAQQAEDIAGELEKLR